ncbi:VRR-NUC domain-containing protein [Paracoccus homiensis]|uniref:VRR-NUC domain-containing protein n=1 Tax=Paracoccus homiensis TaxID=364199 RepID=UPI00398D0D53
MTEAVQMWRGRAGRRGRSPGGTKRRADLEGPIQRAVVDRLRFELPGAIVHHSPNEVPLDGDDVRAAIAKAKRNGMVPGFPDVVVVLACRPVTLFFEVKADGGRETKAQRELREAATSAGHLWAVVRSQTEAVACLDAWGINRRGVTRT